MCRFNSGVRSCLFCTLQKFTLSIVKFFFRHPLMEKYRWYWRIEWVHLLLFLQAWIRQPTVPLVPDQTSISTAISNLILSSSWKTRRKFTVSTLHLSFNWILISVFAKHSRSPCMNMKLPFLPSGATSEVLSPYFYLIVLDLVAQILPNSILNT